MPIPMDRAVEGLPLSPVTAPPRKDLSMSVLLKRAFRGVFAERSSDQHVHFHGEGMYGEAVPCFDRNCGRPHLRVD
jgi:hypothetical protein